MAVLMAAVMTGCRKTADEQIMDEVLRDIPNVAGSGKSKDDPDISFEMITETETAASENETTVSETEAAEETSEETEIETEITVDYDDSMFPVGNWVDISGTDEIFYSFDENGRLEVGLQTHSIFGRYTFEDNTLTLIFDIGFEEAVVTESVFDVQHEEKGYRLYYDSEESTIAAAELPAIDSLSQISEQELIAGLTNLFYGFENSESVFLEYYEIWYADRY